MNKEWSNGLSRRCTWGFNLMGAEMWSLTFAEGTPLVTLLRALLVKWQGKPDYRGAGGENKERTDDEKTQEWRPQYGRVLENYEWVLKFSGNWRDHGVPLIKWALVVRWKLSCTEGEKDDSEAKISNCQCKHLENFDKLGGWGRCHKGDQVNFLLDESVYVGHRCKYVGRIDGEDKEVVQ